jgi:uncharacterized protein YegL
MKKDLAELIICLDESGSMNPVTDDTIGGVNTFIETHKNLPGNAKLTLIKFDTKYNILYNGVDIQDVQPLNKATYSPGGMTALYDAIGKALDEVGKRYDSLKKKEKPGKVIFLIMTDGQENASMEYNIKNIKQSIEKRQKENAFEFIFMGADQDAWGAANSMGVLSAINYTVNDTEKTIKAAAYFSANSRMYSSNTSLDNFNLAEEDLDRELTKIRNNKS